MPLTDADKERVRYHTGYLAVSPAASLSYGIPRPLQTVFLLETAMANLIEAAVARVQHIIQILDDIETKLVEAQDRLAAAKLGELELRTGEAGQSEPDLLEREYVRWAMRLADILGVPLYPYAKRFASVHTAVNVPVRS